MASSPSPSPQTPRIVVLHYAKVDGQDRLLPEGGNPIKIRPGRKVSFVAGDDGATGLKITFTRISPFGDEATVLSVSGGSTFSIKREQSPNPADNKYPFDCEVNINGAPVKAIGGGEIEIDPEG